MLAGLSSHLEALGRYLFPSSFLEKMNSWENSIPCGSKTEDPASLLAVSSQFLEAACVPCHMAPSIFKTVKVHVLNHFLASNLSDFLLCNEPEKALSWSHVIRSGLLGNPIIEPGLASTVPCSQANLLTPGCGAGRYSIIAGWQARRTGSSSKDPNFSMTFRERFLKAV